MQYWNNRQLSSLGVMVKYPFVIILYSYFKYFSSYYFNNIAKKLYTLSVILIMPVKIETLENSTALNISIFSENSFWILLNKLWSNPVLKIKYEFRYADTQ